MRHLLSAEEPMRERPGHPVGGKGPRTNTAVPDGRHCRCATPVLCWRPLSTWPHGRAPTEMLCVLRDHGGQGCGEADREATSREHLEVGHTHQGRHVVEEQRIEARTPGLRSYQAPERPLLIFAEGVRMHIVVLQFLVL